MDIWMVNEDGHRTGKEYKDTLPVFAGGVDE